MAVMSFQSVLSILHHRLQCPPSSDPVPYCAEEWTPEQAGLPDWNADEEAVQQMKQTLFLFNQDKPSYAR